MDSVNLERDLVIEAAVRYALEHDSYIGSAVQNYLKKYWYSIDDKTKETVFNLINDYLAETKNESNRHTWAELKKDLDIITNNSLTLINAIKDRKLYFDFSNEREQDKVDYEQSGYEWDDEYSYYLIDTFESDFESEFGEDKPGYYILQDEEGCVDFLRFHINNVQIDGNHILINDANDGSIRKLIIR